MPHGRCPKSNAAAAGSGYPILIENIWIWQLVTVVELQLG
jgi:hypothetical protein